MTHLPHLLLNSPSQPLDDFERAVLPYMDDAYTLARYLLRHEHDAQDVVQESYLRALRYFDPHTISDVRAWLLTIVRHSCFNWKTKRRAEDSTVEYDDDLHAPADPSPNPEALTIVREENRALHAASIRSPPTIEEILILREIEQLSYKEISRVVGIPVGTVMSRLARARRRLQDALGAIPFAPPGKENSNVIPRYTYI